VLNFVTVVLNKRRYSAAIILLLLIAAGLFFQLRNNHLDEQPRADAKLTAERMPVLTASLGHKLDSLVLSLNGSLRFNERQFAASVAAADPSRYFIFLLYEGDRLLWWSENRLQPEQNQIRQWGRPGALQCGNGWYYGMLRSFGNYRLLGLIQIRQQFVLKNKYLQNDFHPFLGTFRGAVINDGSGTNSTVIRDHDGRKLFDLSFPSAVIKHTLPNEAKWCFGLALFLSYLLLFDLMRILGRRKHPSGYGVAIVLVALRLAMAIWKWPQWLYGLSWFGAAEYASGFLLNSIGDLVLTTGTLSLCITYLVYRLYSRKEYASKRFLDLKAVALFYTSLLFAFGTNHLLQGLVINSNIPFDTGNIFSLNLHTGLGAFVTGIILFSLFAFTDASVLHLRSLGSSTRRIMRLFLIACTVFLATLLIFYNTIPLVGFDPYSIVPGFILLLFIIVLRFNDNQVHQFTRTIFILVAISVYAASLLHNFNTVREQEKRHQVALRLENEQDRVAEYLLNQVALRLQKDTMLAAFLKTPLYTLLSVPGKMEEMNLSLNRRYFGGYMSRYEAVFRYFNVAEMPLNRSGDPSWNLDFLRQRLDNAVTLSGSAGFRFYRDESGNSGYIGILKIGDQAGTVAIDLNTRYSGERSGLPELLMTDDVGSFRYRESYDFARYKDGALVDKGGAFGYFMTDGPYRNFLENSDDGFSLARFKGFEHLFYRSGNDLVIVSSPLRGWWPGVTLFSYLFTFFSLCYFLAALSILVLQNGFANGVNFKARIQATIVILVTSSLFLIGAATITYIVDNYQQAQRKNIREKLHNLRVLIENAAGGRESLGEGLTDDLRFVFSQLSTTLRTDFNIYSPEGLLLFSSQPAIYEQAIAAPLMNRDALTGLTTLQNADFLQNENIGLLYYLAAYEPLRNESGRNIGFLSLPYFDRDTELKRDISGFLVTLINIYVLLFSLSLIIAFFISNRITFPLMAIQENLRRIKLGAQNSPIRWKTKDEIGELIKEYNRMVSELQKSAELLARSERESAWREMAKQVAHEIKNPLTPMKLGIQHLERAFREKHPDREQLAARVSAALIEQINTLANIADEFSHFARMPGARNVPVDVCSILRHTCSVYDQPGLVDVSFRDPGHAIEAKGDRDQLVRIFGNLVKNAIQSIPEGRKGDVLLSVVERDKTVTVEIMDNGIGIPKDRYENIFSPDFTTKAGGVGIGLAMVKTMLEGAGGQIWFKSREGEGTTFFVSLPGQDVEEQPAS